MVITDPWAESGARERRSLVGRFLRWAVKHDTEVVSITAQVLSGLVLGAGPDVLARNEATSGMEHLPQWFWLALFLGLGLWRLIVLLYERDDPRQWGAVISAGVWIWVAFLMTVTGAGVFAPAIFPALAFGDILTAVRVGRGHGR